MKQRIVFWVGVCVITQTFTALAGREVGKEINQEIKRTAVPGEFFVAVDSSIGVAGLNLPHSVQIESLANADIVFEMESQGDSKHLQIVKIKAAQDIDSNTFADELSFSPGVVWASPNYEYEGDFQEDVGALPNDPLLLGQYQHQVLKNFETWEVATGKSDVVVAVPDNGFDLAHEDLINSWWANPREVPDNGIDDDRNGYVDDVRGWNFVDNNNDASFVEDNDHGTHLAGIIAATQNNGIGVSGTAPGIKLMPLKLYQQGSRLSSERVARAFAYAVNNGAKIISTSFVLDPFAKDRMYLATMAYVYSKGVLHVGSAGNNEAMNPVRTTVEESLFVCATTAGPVTNDLLADYSNYGLGVDVCAPGGDEAAPVLSTTPGSTYGDMFGTSMAAPQAAAVAALIWSVHPEWTRDQVAAQLVGTTDPIDALNPNRKGYLGSGRISSYRAVSEKLGAPQIKKIFEIDSRGTAKKPKIFNVMLKNVLNPKTVARSANWLLIAAGQDEVLGTEDDSSYELAAQRPYKIGANFVALTVPAGIKGKVRFIAKGTGEGALADPFGTPLDGNGDSVSGDDFVVDFTVL